MGRMWLLAALLTAVCFGINNTLFKWSTKQQMSKINLQFFFYAAAFLLTLSYGLLYSSFHFSPVSVLLGAAIGILNANGNIQMSAAFEKGFVSLTAPVIASNVILPVLAAGLLFHEKVETIHWIGIVCMLASAAVIQYSPGAMGSSNYRPWLFRVGLAVLSFGTLGILMKLSSQLHIQSLDALVSMYGGGALYLGLRLQRTSLRMREAKVGLLVGLLSIVGYSSYFFAVRTGVASIVFPVVSLNCLVVVLAGRYVFQERLRMYQMLGIAAALFGLVLTKL
ncbi:EamA family transporter [Ectobacillus ponti]|uniref:DMT family transporter n=1 Tax=Ectobacillus ponti TaxID=2961894 RepID=A0AA41X5Y7_9BACI|nr:EamA family transporter [Ectobacillus ponti]MCP8969561.1 DMT family transporter [Ectobacillus ponti]